MWYFKKSAGCGIRIRMGYPGSVRGLGGQRPAVPKTAVYANFTNPAWGAVAVRMREAVAGIKPAKANGVWSTPLCLPGFAVLPAPSVARSVIPVPSFSNSLRSLLLKLPFSVASLQHRPVSGQSIEGKVNHSAGAFSFHVRGDCSLCDIGDFFNRFSLSVLQSFPKKNSHRIQYYKHYDGKKPVCGGKKDALGFTTFKLHDDTQGREVHDFA